ncbi:MAG: hypothetical protein GEU88_01065 [Solirubrobacterales bacterium]|nr:hypothetical protein [Solirubrobacterales bacterium]
MRSKQTRQIKLGPRSPALVVSCALGVLVGLAVVVPNGAQAATAGDLDTSFGGDGKVTFDVFGGVDDAANAVAIQADGKIVAAGSWCGFGAGCTTRGFALARFDADGSLDASFGVNGRALVTFPNGPAEAAGVAIQPDGKIVAAGWRDDDDGVDDADFALVRLEPDGELDPSFSGDGKLITSFGGHDVGHALAIQADGGIVVAGEHWSGDDGDFALARYNENGALDASFDGDGRVTTGFDSDGDEAYAVAIQADGQIVAAGHSLDDCDFGEVCIDHDFTLARYNRNGTLDISFSGDGKVAVGLGEQDIAYAVAIQADGRIVAAGGAGGFAAFGDFALARFNPNGSLDASLDGDGKLTTDFGSAYDRAGGMAIQADGKIVAAGRFGTSELALARYHPSGVLDSTFSGDGRLTTDFGQFDYAGAVAIQADGKIVAAGTTRGSESADDGDIALARYHGVIDDTPPETTITAGPSALTNDPTPTFGFESSEPGSTFRCSLDGAVYSPCDSPHTTAALADGAHTLRVRAIDGAGNIEPDPAERGFTVDTTPPNTIIDSGPAGTTADRTPTFAFRSSEADSSFRCRVDGAGFAPCASPHTTAALAAGEHIFRVRAIDEPGNSDPTPARRAFTVDTGGPIDDPEDPPASGPDDGAGPSAAALAQDTTVSIQVRGRRLKLRQDRRAVLRLACPPTEVSPPCTGDLRLRTAMKVGYRGKTRRLTLARGGYSIGAGETRAVKPRLSRRKAKLVHTSRKARKVKAIIRASDGAGNTALVTARVRLKPA